MAARGRFITFEGGDGVGKTTQAAHLSQSLESRGIDTVVTFEPGGTPFGERVREIFLGDAGEALNARTQALMLNAARMHHLTTVIHPALEKGLWVICDRFADSTTAYQGIVGGAGMDWVAQLDRLVTQGMRPDLTILLTLAPGSMARRLSEREKAVGNRIGRKANRYDRQDAGAHERLDAAFKQVAQSDPERFVVLDGNEQEMVLAGRILDEVDSRFGPLTEWRGT